jgi:hypothetical protein
VSRYLLFTSALLKDVYFIREEEHMNSENMPRWLSPDLVFPHW